VQQKPLGQLAPSAAAQAAATVLQFSQLKHCRPELKSLLELVHHFFT
jgi:hypothetical protein